ncbi:hypothetical protein JL720_11408 [Aureococcus anophagefferens]|nr:hypothetical protein JL720_11408 [Aureococcus anophagefferens]
MKLAATLLAAAAGGGGGDCLKQAAPGAARSSTPSRTSSIGMKSYGRNSAFLMRVGYEQVSLLVDKPGPGAAAAFDARHAKPDAPNDNAAPAERASCPPRRSVPGMNSALYQLYESWRNREAALTMADFIVAAANGAMRNASAGARDPPFRFGRRDAMFCPDAADRLPASAPAASSGSWQRATERGRDRLRASTAPGADGRADGTAAREGSVAPPCRALRRRALLLWLVVVGCLPPSAPPPTGGARPYA